MNFSSACRESIVEKLRLLYGDRAPDVLARLERLGAGFARRSATMGPLWTQRDAVLITYADNVAEPDASPLEALRRFLADHEFDRLLTTVHLLPFFPYTSDDGFSVADYRAVDHVVGTWEDVERLGETFELMFDLVLNHCSQASCWFCGYLEGEEPYDRFFIEADPDDSRLALVTRPRSLPLLTEFESTRGTRHVWTTFSADQVDLNFAEPDVLVEMCAVLLEYVARGACIVRLDAIAYLWKRLGTSCIHLPETHAVVKLMRSLLEELAPRTLLLTETNVPHAENVSYFGDGDEAHMVYQFSLGPLLLDAFVTGDPKPFNTWLSNLEPPRPGTTYFNFTASHDGIGVRPLEGLVDTDRRDRLIEEIRRRGGSVSMKRNSDGSDTPYELNITWYSALGDPEDTTPDAQDRHVSRFLASQTVMLALQGIPGIYIHSLFGTPNWTEGVALTGRPRTINRRKFRREELDALIADTTAPHSCIFDRIKRLLAIRAAHPAFHPDAAQQALHVATPGLIAFRRTSLDGSRQVLVLCNVTAGPIVPDLSLASEPAAGTDLITSEPFRPSLAIEPYRTVWVERTKPAPAERITV